MKVHDHVLSQHEGSKCAIYSSNFHVWSHILCFSMAKLHSLLHSFVTDWKGKFDKKSENVCFVGRSCVSLRSKFEK